VKVGDLVRFNDQAMLTRFNSSGILTGIVTMIDDSHRQAKADILFCDILRLGIWEGHLEVISEAS